MLKNSLNFGEHSSISFTIILNSEELPSLKNFPQPVRQQKNSSKKNIPFIFFTKIPHLLFYLLIQVLLFFKTLKFQKIYLNLL